MAIPGAQTGGLLPTGAAQPLGTLSVDAGPGDNTASSVGPIASSASISEACNDFNPEIVLGLVVGNPDGTDGIPAGQDIVDWQARIQFDPNVVTLVAHTVTDNGASGAGLYMEKAADHTRVSNPHILVSNPSPAPGIGTLDIGSRLLAAPAGANGVGLLAYLFFDCVRDGTTSIDIDDSANSFYTDINGVKHEYAGRNGALLAVNVGEEALADRTPTFTTPADEPGPAGVTQGVSGDGDGGDGWLIPAIAAGGGVAGLTLIAGAAYWRRYRRRA